MAQPLTSSTVRIYKEKDHQKFKELKDFLDEHSRNYSKQKAFLFAMRLGYLKLEELKREREKIENNLP